MRQETYFVRPTEEGLLDLDDEVIAQEPMSDDVLLDLDFDENAQAGAAGHFVVEPEQRERVQSPEVHEATAESESWSAPASASASDKMAEAPVVASTGPSPVALSSQQIDAIARQVVERLSDKAVRDIAWEVVPELAELLIKKRMEEEK